MSSAHLCPIEISTRLNVYKDLRGFCGQRLHPVVNSAFPNAPESLDTPTLTA